MSSFPYYILIGKRVFKTDLEGYAKWERKKPDRSRIALTNVSPTVVVSTVFLMIDHGYHRGEGKPVVFETMVFGGKHNGDGERYTTYNKALNGHERWVTIAREGIKKTNLN